MASDPGSDPSDPNDDDETGGDVDREELRSMIREELRSVLDEFDFSGAGEPTGEGADPAPGKPLTLRDIEAASFNGTRKAMTELQRKPRKKPAAEKTPPEPPPTDPPRGIGERVREVLWG